MEILASKAKAAYSAHSLQHLGVSLLLGLQNQRLNWFALISIVQIFISVSAVAASPQIELSVPHAPSVYRTEGSYALRSEIHLENTSEASFVLKRLQIRDAKRNFALATFSDGQLLKLVQPLDLAVTPKTDSGLQIMRGAKSVIYIDLPLVRDRRISVLEFRLEYDVVGARIKLLTTTLSARVNLVAPAVLGAPLGEGLWVAVHHAGWKRGHRRMFYHEEGIARLPGRYAIDFVGVDSNGLITHGNADRTSDAIGYGAHVIAVADARVVGMRDGVSETGSIAANGKHSADMASGNYVVLDIGQGRYAFYEHLQTGSILVRPGAPVRRGQALAKLGFSGDSNGPHLHFHVADGKTPLSSEGLPFVIAAFHQHGRYEDLGHMGQRRWQQSNRLVEYERPPENTVLEFEKPHDE